MQKLSSVGKLLAGLTGLVVVLSGCIKMDMDMKVNKDETIEGSAIIAFSTQLLEMTGQKKSDMVKEIKKDWKDLPKGAKAEVYDKDGFIGQKITFKNMPASEFGKVTQSAGSANPTGGGDEMVLVKEGGNWKFAGSMDMTGNLGGTDPSGKKSGNSGDVSAMMKGMKVKIKMTFPGKILKHDKDGKVKDKSITWEPKAGQKVAMLAIAKAS